MENSLRKTRATFNTPLRLGCAHAHPIHLPRACSAAGRSGYSTNRTAVASLAGNKPCGMDGPREADYDDVLGG
jgi:hypothetical protein